MAKQHQRIKPIKSDADYREALALIDELIDAKPGTKEYRVLHSVSDLVYDYEEQNIKIHWQCEESKEEER